MNEEKKMEKYRGERKKNQRSKGEISYVNTGEEKKNGSSEREGPYSGLGKDQEESGGGKEKRLYRMLSIYTKLMNGEIVRKKEEAECYKVNEKSIQRDILYIRNFLEEKSRKEGFLNSIEYDRKEKGYRLGNTDKLKLSENEVLAICKILLGSRALTKKEMDGILDGLIHSCVSRKAQKKIEEMIRNERFLYVEPQHKTAFIESMGVLAEAIRHSRCIIIDYQKMKQNELITRKICPVSIMFSEYYFYLLAFIDGEQMRRELNLEDNYTSPTIYRIDRIKKIEVSDENFRIPSRFEEGEYRKKIQFMYGGKMHRVKFKYSGLNIEAVLDRLPTARILEKKDGVYIVTAEVLGTGVDMWLRGQGEDVEMLE